MEQPVKVRSKWFSIKSTKSLGLKISINQKSSTCK